MLLTTVGQFCPVFDRFADFAHFWQFLSLSVTIKPLWPLWALLAIFDCSCIDRFTIAIRQTKKVVKSCQAFPAFHAELITDQKNLGIDKQLEVMNIGCFNNL
eukprot:EG_transcript_36371